MIFHNTFTITTFATALLLVSSIQDITEVQAISSSGIKDNILKAIPFRKSTQVEEQEYFYGHPMGKEGVFKDKNLKIYKKSTASNNQVSSAFGYFFDPATKKDQAVDLLCGPADKAIRTVEKQSNWINVDRKFLLYQDLYAQYMRQQDKSIFRTVDFNLIERFAPTHVCYMTPSMGDKNQPPLYEFYELTLNNLGVVDTLLNRIRNGTGFKYTYR
ncbi:hypothetical protein BDF19DRAFT_420470 [Syncephalis fuscata]|nr:hypothetical protein BDF19DRAFT_420470 [Syncephalis fuscata]